MTLPTPKQKKPEPIDLAAVDGGSVRNLWAVGTYGVDGGRSQRAFFEHWNGRSWRLKPCPNAAKFSPTGIAVASARAAWAVGFHLRRHSTTLRTWILRWNGSSWKRVPSPNPGRFDDELSAVSAYSARNAWAVGEYRRGRRIYTLVLHWDGVRWKQVASPSLGSPRDSSLSGVVAVGAKEAWAVGEYAPRKNSERPLVEHWDGHRWKVVPAPATVPTAGFDRLDAVAASSARDVWAVGTSFSAGPAQGFSEHWDGSSWKVVPLPDAPVPGGLGGIAAASSHAAWAVGSFETAP